MLWSDVIARCQAEAARRAGSRTARVRPRGATIANRVGVQRRRRPDRHVQLKEQQAQRQQERVKAAKTYRAAHIKKLRGILLNDDAALLLRQPDDGSATISRRQGARATTQAWVVLKTYEEIGSMEDDVLNYGAPVPRGGIAMAAAASSAAYFGVCGAETAREWRFEYEQNEGKFDLDGRGKALQVGARAADPGAGSGAQISQMDGGDGEGREAFGGGSMRVPQQHALAATVRHRADAQRLPHPTAHCQRDGVVLDAQVRGCRLVRYDSIAPVT